MGNRGPLDGPKNWKARHRLASELIDEARKLIEEQRDREALGRFVDYRRLGSWDPNVMFEMASCHERLAECPQALEIYEEVRLRFQELLSRRAGGRLFLHAADREEASTREAWNEFHNQAFGHSQRIRGLLGKPLLPDNLAFARQVLAMMDGTFAPDVHLQEGRYTEALAGYLATDAEVNIANQGTNAAIGKCYEGIGDLTRAIAHYKKVCEFCEKQLGAESESRMWDVCRGILRHYRAQIEKLKRKLEEDA